MSFYYSEDPSTEDRMTRHEIASLTVAQLRQKVFEYYELVDDVWDFANYMEDWDKSKFKWGKKLQAILPKNFDHRKPDSNA